jgi:hypothetical protein
VIRRQAFGGRPGDREVVGLGAARGARAGSVHVNGDEEARGRPVGHLDPRLEVLDDRGEGPVAAGTIARAGHQRPVAALAQPAAQAARDVEVDVLLEQQRAPTTVAPLLETGRGAVGQQADRPGVVAAVPGVDGDQHRTGRHRLPLGGRGGRRGRRRRSRRGRGCRGRRNLRRRRLGGAAQRHGGGGQRERRGQGEAAAHGASSAREIGRSARLIGSVRSKARPVI